MTSGPEKQITTPQLPDSAPKVFPGTSYDFTLQAILEMQRTLGKLEQAITDLTGQSEKYGKDLKDIGQKVYAAKVLITVSGVIVTALGGVSVFFLDKIWKAVVPLLQIKPHP